MRLSEFTSVLEEPLSRHEMGMGLEQFSNNYVVLAGGMRSGNSPAGLTRLKYMVYDLVYMRENNVGIDDSQAGFVELFGDDSTRRIVGMVNIEFKKARRRAGLGQNVMDSLIDSEFVDKPLKLYDIQPKAYGFWKKMGVQFTTPNFQTPITNLSKARKGSVFGLLESSNTIDTREKLMEVAVTSSWINSLDYDPETEDVIMTVKRRKTGRRTRGSARGGGKAYVIPGIDPDTFEDWKRAASKGKFWHEVIKWMIG